MTKRVTDHPVLGKLTNMKEVTFTYDGKTYTGYEGESIAAALLANDVRTLRHHEEDNEPRGIYCNIGHCFECRVTINDKSGIRACLTPLEEGMDITSGKQLPNPVKDWSVEHV